MITSDPISGNLLTIDGLAIPEIKSYTVGQNKLWKDAERNMNGTVKATLIGVVPKIELEFNYMNRTRMAAISAKLNMAYFSVSYFDPTTNGTRTANFYAGDYNVELERKDTGLMRPAKVSLIAVSVR